MSKEGTEHAAHGRASRESGFRPHAVAAVVPSPSVSLSFLAAAPSGLADHGAALAWAGDAATADPTVDPVVAAAHLGALAT